MPDTTFIAHQTVITATWLNYINDVAYSGNSGTRGSTMRALLAKVGDRTSVKDYGAVADGNRYNGTGTNNSPAFQAAINACVAAGGTAVEIPEGIYLLTSKITVPGSITLYGAGQMSTILTCPNAFNDADGLIRVYDSGNSGLPTVLSGFGVFAQENGCASPGIVVDKNGTIIEDIWINGFNSVGPGLEINRTDTFVNNVVIEYCLNGLYSTTTDVNCHNMTIYECTNGVVVANTAATGVGRNTFVDVRITACTQKAYVLDSAKYVSILGGSMSHTNNERFSLAGVHVRASSSDIIISDFTAKIGAPASVTCVGILVEDSSAVDISGAMITGCLDGIKVSGTSSAVNIRGGFSKNNGRYGVHLVDGDKISVSGINTNENGSQGLRSENTGSGKTHTLIGNTCSQGVGGAQNYGIYASLTDNGDTSGYTTIVGNTALNNNTAQIQFAGRTRNIIHAANTPVITGHTLAAVASAATITVPYGATVISVTGTTNITSVAAGFAGQEVTLIFAGILTFTDGSNLKLAGNLVTTADDTITLVCDGTNWYEKSRSVN